MCLGKSKFPFHLHEKPVRESPFRILHWKADVQVWLEVSIFVISYWEADVQVWLEI